MFLTSLRKVECTHCSRTLTTVKALLLQLYLLPCRIRFTFLKTLVISFGINRVGDLLAVTLQAFKYFQRDVISEMLCIGFLCLKILSLRLFISLCVSERIWRDCWMTSISKMRLFASTSLRRDQWCWICTAPNLSLCS